ncbi:MAG TPA: hypothetical protein VGK93_08240 [Candidatus Eisenbacteria bacterium]
MKLLYPASAEHLAQMLAARVKFHLSRGVGLSAAKKLAAAEAEQFSRHSLLKHGVLVGPPGAVKIV